mmetsp:Transcript_72902/g.126599  ORF Transcript_72902/g.126599 Transcript_72902/m.126599 type:complete len:419 (-) Transcript_72902:119-1375(-)
MYRAAKPQTMTGFSLSQTDPSYQSYQQTYAQTMLPAEAQWTDFTKVPESKSLQHARRYHVAKAQMDDTERIRESLWQFGSRGDCLNVDSYLLDRPSAVNMPVEFDLGTPLHVASMRGHADLAQLLLHRRADVNRTNAERQTSLHNACELNQGAAVMELLAAGGDADQRDFSRQTPLHRAAWSGAEDALLALLEYSADLRVRDEGGLMPIHKAATMGRADSISMILERDPAIVNVEAADGWTPLHLAAHGGHMVACEALLAYGADSNASDAERMQPLHRACTSGSDLVCQVLVRGGADMRALDRSQNTPLHTACQEGHTMAARALLEMGAPLDLTDHMRRTPLHVATEAGNFELCEALLQFLADPGSMDINKGIASPLAIARRSRQPEIVGLFEAAVNQAAVSQAQASTAQLPTFDRTG